MLKNMKTQKYESLMQIRSKQKLLLTGTPLQNNILELLSLLNFVMPSLFHKHICILNKMFVPKSYNTESDMDVYYTEKIHQLRGFVFVLVRLPCDL